MLYKEALYRRFRNTCRATVSVIESESKGQIRNLASSLIICIDGIIGAGKSSLIRKLKNNFTCFEEPVQKWSLLLNLYSDMERYAIPFQFQVLFSQYDQYLLFKNINDLIIVERCPWTSKNVFAQMYIDNGLFDEASALTYHKLSYFRMKWIILFIWTLNLSWP